MCYQGVLLYEATSLQNSWQLGRLVSPSQVFHEMQMTFHEFCSMVLANQNKNILVDRYVFSHCPFEKLSPELLEICFQGKKTKPRTRISRLQVS